jgi:hypothetical protein
MAMSVDRCVDGRLSIYTSNARHFNRHPVANCDTHHIHSNTHA